MIVLGSKPKHARRSQRMPANAGGCRGRDRVGPEEILDDLLKNDGQTEGDQNLICMGTLVEVLDQARAPSHEADRRS